MPRATTRLATRSGTARAAICQQTSSRGLRSSASIRRSLRAAVHLDDDDPDELRLQDRLDLGSRATTEASGPTRRGVALMGSRLIPRPLHSPSPWLPRCLAEHRIGGDAAHDPVGRARRGLLQLGYANLVGTGVDERLHAAVHPRAEVTLRSCSAWEARFRPVAGLRPRCLPRQIGLPRRRPAGAAWVVWSRSWSEDNARRQLPVSRRTGQPPDDAHHQIDRCGRGVDEQAAEL